MSRNVAIIAAAGARKTQAIIDEAIAAAPRRVLITTYTNENLRQLESRISDASGGALPDHIDLASWFGFLLRDGVRPYQASVFGRVGIVHGLNFVADRPRGIKATEMRFHLDRNADVWRDAVADLVYRVNDRSGGAMIDRMERIYDHIFIDEVQDLVGWDLEILDLLFAADLDVTVVGDPRQYLYWTNNGTKNKKYRGAGITDWFHARSHVCPREDRHVSHRCNQEICDFASALFPDYPAITAASDHLTGHDGIHIISRFDVLEYSERFNPQVLRRDKRENTQGLPGMNFGVSKGSTFDRVLIFPTVPMREYLQHRDPTRLKPPESLYVAVTRARFSVAFVV